MYQCQGFQLSTLPRLLEIGFLPSVTGIRHSRESGNPAEKRERGDRDREGRSGFSLCLYLAWEEGCCEAGAFADPCDPVRGG
jgi:hypothetical protein